MHQKKALPIKAVKLCHVIEKELECEPPESAHWISGEAAAELARALNEASVHVEFLEKKIPELIKELGYPEFRRGEGIYHQLIDSRADYIMIDDIIRDLIARLELVGILPKWTIPRSRRRS